jgi:hypothetical protein
MWLWSGKVEGCGEFGLAKPCIQSRIPEFYLESLLWIEGGFCMRWEFGTGILELDREAMVLTISLPA